MSISTVITVGQVIARPPLSFLRREVIGGGPFSGSFQFQRQRLGLLVDATGIAFHVESVPEGFGRKNTWGRTTRYDRDVVEVQVLHTLSDSTSVFSQIDVFDLQVGYVIFGESFPAFVNVSTAPGVFVQLDWLLFLP